MTRMVRESAIGREGKMGTLAADEVAEGFMQLLKRRGLGICGGMLCLGRHQW